MEYICKFKQFFRTKAELLQEGFLFCTLGIFINNWISKKLRPPGIQPASKVAHNPTRPRVLTSASIWLCGTETAF